MYYEFCLIIHLFLTLKKNKRTFQLCIKGVGRDYKTLLNSRFINITLQDS